MQTLYILLLYVSAILHVLLLQYYISGLVSAAGNGDLSKVKGYLREGVDVNGKDYVSTAY